MSIPRLVAVCAAFLAAGQIAFYSPRLPRTVASQFDLAGNPSTWTSKQSFIVVYGAMVTLFVVLAFAVGILIDRIPASMINIPNRSYWFSGDREAEARKDLSNFVLWLFAAILVLLVLTFELVFEANAGYARNLPMSWFWPILLAFCVFFAGWLARLYARFRLPDEGIR